MEPKRYTITAALPYANGPLHIGHLAGAYLPADTYVRYLRMRQREVVFVCGSDEHGAAITLRAKKDGTTPQVIIDRYHAMIRDSFQELGIDFDIYHRTSEPIHHQTSQDFFTKLYDKGEFVEKETEQYYDEAYNQFLADRYIQGTCPVCANPNAYGDQCERCGSTLNPTDLIEPRSTLSGNKPVLKTTRHWYLPLDKYQPWLEEWLLEGKKDTWKTNVYGQCSSWLKAGLQPRSMTRDLDWGVDVPLPDAVGKKLYVWLDAPIGYISATKQWAADHGKDWKAYWYEQPDPADNSRLIHFIGKDNIVFHCIIFPSLLHAHGDFLVPDQVPANEFLNLEGNKLSTSRNWAVWAHEYLQDFPGRQDELRYVLTSIMPETKDSEFTWKDYQSRVNNELVKILGNFVNRVAVLTQKYYDGVVPEPVGLADDAAASAVWKEITDRLAGIESNLELFRFRDALQEYMNIARAGNGYLTAEEPWKKWNNDNDSVSRSLYICVQISAVLGALGRIFLPVTGGKIADLIKTDLDFSWEAIAAGHLVPSGHAILQGQKPEVLFTPIEDSQIEEQVEKLHATLPAPEAPAMTHEPLKEEISFDDFQKMDIRLGTILEAEKVPKTKKLLKFQVDTGLDVRTIVSGVAEYFEPESLVGKQVPVLMNLKPRTIQGIESKGMILFAESAEGKLHQIGPEGVIDAGSGIR